MLGVQPAGPASGHGSERGLGGTRSDDGLWNDRVLNAAQRQVVGRGHNRVTSFSSETRRANSARARGGAGGRGGALQSGASGSGTGRGIHDTVGGSDRGVSRERPSYQRRRSSSFTTASERPRGGSGRVQNGTRAERGGAPPRLGDIGSPRSRSDLGLGSKDGDHLRATSDAILSRHAMRHSAGGIKATPKTFGEDGTGAWAAVAGAGSGAQAGSDAEVAKRTIAVVTVSSKSTSKKGVHSRGQGPSVITVRRVKPGMANNKESKANTGNTQKSVARDSARSSGGAESDLDGSRRGETKTDRDDDSSPEPTTKALTYGPRKPRVYPKTPPDKMSNGEDRSNPGHRRVPSIGSNTSADESSSAFKIRKRFLTTSTDAGSGNYLASITAAATAEAAARLLRRKPKERTSRVGGRSTAEGVSGHSSGGESSSDATSGSVARRRPSKSSITTVAGSEGASAGTVPARHRTISAGKATPPKTGPVTRGTPAPPMAAARAASWNVSAPVPPFTDQSESSELDPAMQRAEFSQELRSPEEQRSSEELHGQKEASAPCAEEDSSAPNSPRRLSSSGGGGALNLRVPSTNNSNPEFFGFGSNNPGGGVANTPADGNAGAGGRAGSRDRTLASQVFRAGGCPTIVSGRLFTSGSAARIGAGKSSAGIITDSEDERGDRSSDETRRVIALRSGSVKASIICFF